MKKLLSIILALSISIILPLSGLQISASQLGDIEISGHYENPNTGIIEDSGGESSYALGQSMVENMMSTEAVLEENSDGTYTLTFDFNLYNYISDIEFQFQNKGETTYSDLDSQIIEEQEETVTLQVSVDTLDGLLRASCYVIPMGRSVVFYITYSDTFDEGSVSTDTLVDDYSDSDTTSSTTSTSTNDDVLGLTLSSGLTTDSDDTSLDNDTDSSNIDIVFDDSFWVTAFFLVLCANLISGSLLIFVYHMIKTKVLGKKELESGDELDELEQSQNDNEDLIDMSSFIMEDNKDNNEDKFDEENI